MDTKQILDTMVVSGLISGYNNSVLEVLEGSKIDIVYTQRRIDGLLEEMGVREYRDLIFLRSVTRLAVMCERHDLGMKYRDFLDEFLKIYKMRYSDSHLRQLNSLDSSIIRLDKVQSYGIDLNEFRIVKGTNYIIKKNRGMISVGTSVKNGLAVFNGFGDEMTCGCMVKENEVTPLICESLQEECNMILRLLKKDKESMDVAFLPSLEASKWRLLKACNKECLTVKEFIQFLRVIEVFTLNLDTDLKELVKVEDSKYDIKDIFIKLIRLNSSDCDRIITNAVAILEASDVSQENIDELNEVLGVQLDFIHKSSLVDIDKGKTLREMIKQIESIKQS